MESLEVMENGHVTCNGGVLKFSDKNVEKIEILDDNRNFEEIVNGGDDVNVKEIENPDFLNDLELYFEDINDRLTISRMVSDSVIRGMVSAVEQEAEQKVAKKDLELARLKETMQLFHVGCDNGAMQYSGVSLESKDCSDVLTEHYRVPESMGNLKVASKEQFKRLKKEIDKIRRKGLGSELVGLSGILEEKMLDRWIDVDRMIDALKTTIDSFYEQMEYMFHSSRTSLIEWQQEREFQVEVEGMVIQTCIWGLHKDFEQRWWDQNAKIYDGKESANQLCKIKEISSVRRELEVISKSLSACEGGQLISHGSLEHWKTSANHVPSTPSLCDGNGKLDQSIINMPENFDLSTLKHMGRDELASYFKNEMTKMKRQHESKVQELTEECFSLKRKYLNERGSSVIVKKDEELESVRRKIPEVISKLDRILVETEKVPAFHSNAENIDNLKERLESLYSENHQLRDLLTVKKKELRSLSTQVSDAAEKMSEHSLSEANLLKKNLKLKSVLEDAHIEASLSADLFRFLVKELLGQIECSNESRMEQAIDEISKQIARNYDRISKVEVEDSEMESIIMQGICGDIFKEAFKEAEGKFSGVNMQYMNENEVRLSLEMEVLEKEKELSDYVTEKEKLGQQIISLTESVDEKIKLLQEGADALREEKEKFELASQELENLEVQKNQQQFLLALSNEELQDVKSNLAEAIGQIESQNSEITELRKSLELSTKSLSETKEESKELLNVLQEKQDALSLFEAKEAEYKKQVESMIIRLNGLSEVLANFECRATSNIKTLSLRLENLSSEFSWVVQKVSRLKRTGFLYKQKLERRSADLQKAEAEVDLLGDEVDTLLGLLEKIYIALDHYSPVLEHYPGITEILKLVRRELSGESIKSD